MPGCDHRLTDIKAFTLESTLSPYRACKTGTVTGAVTAITATSDNVKGFAIESGLTGENHAIAIDGGIILAEAGAAISADAKLVIDSVGRVVTAAPTTGNNADVVGKALEAATAAGDIIPMQFTRMSLQG